MKTNKIKKEFGVPKLMPSFADGFKRASDERTRIAIRETMGKGDNRRPCDESKVRANWDEIDWSH